MTGGQLPACDPTTWPDAVAFSALLFAAAAVLIAYIHRPPKPPRR